MLPAVVANDGADYNIARNQRNDRIHTRGSRVESTAFRRALHESKQPTKVGTLNAVGPSNNCNTARVPWVEFQIKSRVNYCYYERKFY